MDPIEPAVSGLGQGDFRGVELLQPASAARSRIGWVDFPPQLFLLPPQLFLLPPRLYDLALQTKGRWTRQNAHPPDLCAQIAVPIGATFSAHDFALQSNRQIMRGQGRG